MFGKKRIEQAGAGQQMLKLLTDKEQRVVAGGPKGSTSGSGASTCTYIPGQGKRPC